MRSFFEKKIKLAKKKRKKKKIPFLEEKDVRQV